MSKRILVAGIDKIDPSKFRKPMNEMKNVFSVMNKPEGCLWGSTYTPDAAYPSDWIRWVQDECYEVEKYNHESFSSLTEMPEYVRLILFKAIMK